MTASGENTSFEVALAVTDGPTLDQVGMGLAALTLPSAAREDDEPPSLDLAV